MPRNQRVLIIDESAECREVLRTALERAGAVAVEAQSPLEGLQALDSIAPDLIILDLPDELDGGADTSALETAAGLSGTPIVILGTARRSGGSAVHCIAKPYHFAPLIRRIEGLLSAVA